ncbi:hypothetical protein CK203_012132 [Vitis vinifera]|uniref:Retrotransposon gag domain-containing protein n=1 Tax=Vitis vinifera TaxID=29760 RepID=A0A438K0L4_VITVI|nr:hypothetical protein CK203_012132 [Vitis vinifera]
MSDELASTLASIQEFMAGVSRRLDQLESSRQDPHPAGVVTDETIPHASQTAQTRLPGVSLGTPFHLVDHYETIPPPTVTVPPPMVPTIGDTRLAEQEAKVERLESMMRQIRLQDGGLTWDDRDGIPAASLPAKFRMPDIERYSGIGCPQDPFETIQHIEPWRLRTWEDVAREFLTQFAFSADIDVSRRELEATRQRSEKSISSFVTRWRAKVAGMDLRSLVHAAFSVEEAMARGIWTDTATSPDSRGKRPIGSSTRSEEHAAATTHPRATTHLLPRPYAQRPARQFTPLGMTLTRAFEKLRDAGVIIPLAPRPLPHPIPPHFRSHEHCLYHQIPGHDTERCSALHHAIHDLIDSGVVDLARPSVTTNPLPAHSTHEVPPPPSLQ